MRLLAFAVSAALLCGCTTTSGVIPIGDGAYTITSGASPGAGGLSGSQQLAYKEANEFCGKQGKQISTVSETSQPMSFLGDGKANTTIRFQCK